MAAMRGRQQGSRTGTFLVLAGIVGVLTATFIAGVWTGHNWPVITGSPRPPVAAEPAPPRRVAADRSPRAADTLPALTFYHDLTAPLTAPPPPSKPAPVRPPKPAEPRREEAGRADVARAEAAAPPAAAPRVELPAAGQGSGRFTVQVAAYNVRPLAEALRATLAAAGHDARVLESESGTGARYRVQVGSFPTREAAREVGARLAAERAQPTFVTTR